MEQTQTQIVLTSVKSDPAPAVLLRRPVTAPVLNNAAKKSIRAARPGWRVLAFALVIGIIGGVGVGLLGGGGSSPKPAVPSMLAHAANLRSVPTDPDASLLAAQSSTMAQRSDELDRLQTRNRRLEALVSVLRDRKDNHARPKPTRR